jgi:integrase
LDRLAAAAGLAPITFHKSPALVRHSGVEGGASPKVVSDRIGHTDVGFFLKTYAHALTKDDREAAEHAASNLLGPHLCPSQNDEHG